MSDLWAAGVYKIRHNYQLSKTGCWIWQGKPGNNGYGLVSVCGVKYLTHRFAYLVEHGKLPDNYALHRCNVKMCVNPAHIYDGDQFDNMRDYSAVVKASGPRTHCRKGHEWSEYTTYLNPVTGRRYCRACYSLSNQKRLKG
jgi:hypothetical protein